VRFTSTPILGRSWPGPHRQTKLSRGRTDWQNRAVLRLVITALVLCWSLLSLGSCGNSRTPVPDLSQPVNPTSFRTLRYSGSTVALGLKRSWSVEFGAPSNWSIVMRRPPVVAVVTSGDAVVALWRYGRKASVPAGAEAYVRARQELIDAARVRDPSLRLISAKSVRVGGDPGIELDAMESVGGQRRRVRSTHVFVPGAELVLDEYAPLAVFHLVDHMVFSPLKRSLRLSVTPAASG
jgi:hypothetical protein